MIFRAHLRFDFDKRANDEYSRLLVALLQAGWSYIETSALAIETEDFYPILIAMELMARQLPAIGQVSGLLLDVQGCESFSGKPYSAERFHARATENILRDRPLPSEQPVEVVNEL